MVLTAAAIAVIAATALFAGPATTAAQGTIDGGSSWEGWIAHGSSDELGVYGSGAVSHPYRVYSTVFTYCGQKAVPGLAGGGGGRSGFGGFANGDRVLGIGIRMLGGESVSGGRTWKLDLGNDSYRPASSVGGSDGRTDSEMYAHDGDYSVQNDTGFVAVQLVVFSPFVNVSSGGGNPYGDTRPFASFRRADSYQFLVNLSKVPAWAAASAGSGVGVGADPIPPFGDRITMALNGYGDNHVVISRSTAPDRESMCRQAYLPVTSRAACFRPSPRTADVALVIDTSSSMSGGKIEAAVAAATDFVGLMDLPRHHVAVIGFNAQATIAQGLTGDRAPVVDAIAKLRLSPGTRIDRALEAARLELGGPRARPSADRHVVLLTDGRSDDGSEARSVALAQAMRAEGTTIFAIGLGDNVNTEFLLALTGASDRVHLAAEAEDLRRIYGAVADAIPCPH